MLAAVLLITSAGAIARYAGHPLIWADEAAIGAMVWSGFLGAAALFGTGGHMAITGLRQALPAPLARTAAICAALVELAFFAGLTLLVWRWFDPVGLLRAGSGGQLARDTFNYIYVEPSQTLGLARIWLWLVMPVFAVTGLVLSGLGLIRVASGAAR